MGTELIRALYGYHRWANRRLFEVAAGLGAEAAARDMGKHWSFPTLTGMFGHIYGADWLWLQRFKGISPTSLPGGEFDAQRGDRMQIAGRAAIDLLDVLERNRCTRAATVQLHPPNPL